MSKKASSEYVTPERQRLMKEAEGLEIKIGHAYLDGRDGRAAQLESKLAGIEQRIEEIRESEAMQARKDRMRSFSMGAKSKDDRPGKKPMLCVRCEKETTPEDSEVIKKSRYCLKCLSWEVGKELQKQ